MSSLTRRHLLQAGSGAGLLSALPLAQAQTRQETVRVLAEGAPNSRDPHGEGVSRESLGTFTNLYDRLINFYSTRLASGIRR